MAPNSPPLTICLIDDDRIYQFTAKRMIELVDPLQKVLIFSDGKEAMDFFSKQTQDRDPLPDVIFLDINMPVMNGWEFLDAYNSIKTTLDKQISIYMISSSVDEKDKIRSKGFNVKDFIEKPINKQMMRAILQSSRSMV
ncbi:response regulator [Segetibacter sp.]|jgi:CheY-like chemotaxis protein|uniref:response regulator n=1 Tax=Segetibacter sp. TaxID=2231182 RepID=UPI00260E925A|nr:response regulator [Segetibacter sp.]MCW3082180.1 response regulator receiver protein [Segetibacter sp.]